MAALFIFPPIPIDRSGLATSALQQLQLDELQDINTSIDNVETSTANIDTNTANIEASAAAIETSSANIETSVSAVETSVDNIDSSTTALNQKVAAALVPEQHDYIALTYVGATTDISTITYKDGGVSGTTVATLTLGYDGSNRLTSVTRS